MLRPALPRCLFNALPARTLSRSIHVPTRTKFPVSTQLMRSSRLPSLTLQSIRNYSAPADLTREEAQGRIMDLLKNFDKITDASKIIPTSHFGNDLGLDSLDTVEVVMAIEEEFSIEIPDKEADAIHSIDQAVTYIIERPDAH